MSQTESDFDAKSFLRDLPHKPGVYRMYNEKGDTLYVGKARSLKKRLSSYFQRNISSPKTRSLVSQIQHIEVTLTHTESEALLLENNLIKSLKPRYNILLRDDKSYPYIYLSSEHDFPRLALHRGAKKSRGRYFGPYPSAGSVRDTLSLLQKLFPIRQCEDSFFNNRSRPCLQYQIKRCTAPCTAYINKDAYANDVRHAVMFLEGKDSQVIDELVKQMEEASSQQNYEQAARFRDQIISLRRIQEKQYITSDKGNLDVIAADLRNGIGCIQLFSIRDGRNLGGKSFYPHHTDQSDIDEMLTAFISQYYLAAESMGRMIPNEILLSHELSEQAWLAQSLSEQAGVKVVLSANLRGDRRRWMKMAETNVSSALSSRLASRSSLLKRFQELQEVLALDCLPQRIECFDISHTMGEETVASCVVFSPEGALKSDYRRFNISGIQGGDDYAALQQALSRRYTRVKKGEGKLPDVLIIDGGKGQIRQAVEVFEELQIEGVVILGIAKGPTRKAGQETLYLSTQSQPFILPAQSPALHLIQQIDAEAHRFAIGGHRQRREKRRGRSPLEEIAGLGPKRRQALLKQLGGLQEVEKAGVDELSRIDGISQALAQRIYDYFHPDTE